MSTLRLPQNPGIGGLEELTSAEETFLTGLAGITYSNGDILYASGGFLTNLGIGSEDQVLTSKSGIPSWEDSLTTETDPVFTAWESITPYLVTADNISLLTNDAGYITSSELSPYALLDGTNHPFTTVKTPILQPSADGTSALKITKADGTTSVITVDTTNIQVGIGTTPLQTNLHVRGATTANNYTQIWGASGASGNLSTLALVKTADVNGAFVFSSFVAGGSLASAPKIHFGGYDATPVNGAKFTMDIANGRFGIGTITPSYPLHIATTVTTPIYTTSSDTNTLYIGSTKGSSLATAQVQLSTPARNMVFASTDQSSGVAGWYDVTAGQWRFAMTHSTGNVAIGGNNITPFGKLHVRTAASGAASVSSNADELIVEGAGVAGMTILAGTTSDASIFFGDSGSQTVGRIVYDHSINDFSIWTNATERVTITSAGDTGFGIALPLYRVHIYNSANSDVGLRIGTVSDTYSPKLIFSKGATEYADIRVYSNGTYAHKNLVSNKDLALAVNVGGTDTQVLTIQGTTGNVVLAEGSDIATGTTTGSIIFATNIQKGSFWGATPVIQQVTNAYTSDGEGSAYTGIDNLQAGTPYAQVTDLNALRVAYETLRASYDDLLTKLKNTGIVA